MVNSYLYHITSLQMHHISSIKSIIISLRGEKIASKNTEKIKFTINLFKSIELYFLTIYSERILLLLFKL